MMNKIKCATVEEISKLSREELVLADVAVGVAKWGEAERAGLEKMSAMKSTATLRAEMAVRERRDHFAVTGVKIVHQPTLGALEDGVS
jgi:hypothetical protein